MRKLLHLALAVWKTGKPFDPAHYPWDRAAHLPGSQATASSPASGPTSPPAAISTNTPAAGHNNPVVPERSVVTAACVPSTLTEAAADRNAPAPASDTAMSQSDATPWIDFEHIKAQLPLTRVLEHLRLLDGLRGREAQRKGPCPLHGSSDAGHKRGLTFSVNLDKNVFQCFQPSCAKKGDVIDLWAALHGLTLRQAAVDLVQKFNLEPAPRTEMRHG